MSNDEATEAIHALRDELVGLRADIKTYGTAERKARRNMRILAVSVLLDVLLSAGLFAGIRKADQASNDARTASTQAAQAASTAVVNCKARNASVLIQKDLWGFVLALTGTPTTPEQIDRTNKFKEYIAEAFKLTDCDA